MKENIAKCQKYTKTAIRIAFWAPRGVQDELKMGPKRPELGPRSFNVAKADIETEDRRPKTPKTRLKMRFTEETRRRRGPIRKPILDHRRFTLIALPYLGVY